MEYIIFSFQKDFLVINKKNDDPSPSLYINSFKDFHNKLIFTPNFYKKNFKNIVNQISIRLKGKQISKAYIEDATLLTRFLTLLKYLKIDTLYIKNYKSLKIEECNLLVQNKNLKNIYCYYIPTYYLKKLKNMKVNVNISYRENVSDNFMISQDAIDSDALYYKKSIHINKNYNYKNKDFLSFLNINSYLRTIHVHEYNKEVLEDIINTLIKENRRYVYILVYQNKNDIKSLSEIKKINNTYKNKLDNKIQIIYNEEYFKKNIQKQIILNNIKFSLIIILYVVFMGLIFSMLYEYVSKINIEKLNYQLSKEQEYSSKIILEDNEDEVINEDTYAKYKLNYSFKTLLNINSDTVGWLNVKGTDINYPVVQSSNNEYYLKHDFYKTYTSLGWVFMDYRNNKNELDSNTIIYGHKLKNGLMFGTLDNVLNKNWYNNKENHIITFNTTDKVMKWQVFSIYKTDYTNDYLSTNFTFESDFEKFILNIKNKSIYNFNIDVTVEDNILTLSTCIGATSSNKRLVLHAKLIN